MPLIIIIMAVAIVAPYTRWDMTAAGWAKATELCIPFGGLKQADESRFWTSDERVTAMCADGQVIQKTYPRNYGLR